MSSRVALVLAVAALAGCGGASGRSELADRLAGLCDEARQDIEALGLPSERGVAVVKPWADRGTRLANTIDELELGSPAERTQVTSLAASLREYYAGLRLGHTVYAQTKSLEAYAATVERAKTFLERADAIAVELGAPECAIRPFPDD